MNSEIKIDIIGKNVEKKGYSSQRCVLILITMKTNKYVTKKRKTACSQSTLAKIQEDKNIKMYNSTITQ